MTTITKNKITLIQDRDAWSSVINSMDDADFYHTYDYHQLSKTDTEKPFLLKYDEKDYSIALPLLVRNIKGTQFKDATSVYGYSGPITKGLSADFDNTSFKSHVRDLFLKNNIITVFSRLNNYIAHQELVLQNIGEIKTQCQTVNIDLTKNLEYQKSQYNKRFRTYINKFHREFSVRLANSQQDIEMFIDMYYENMIRVKAHKKYFFSKEYFYSLLYSHEFKTDLLLAVDKGSQKIIGGAIFIKKNRIVHYHLAGIPNAYEVINPLKLLIDEMRIRATQEGYSSFNLGGGVGNKEDGLFKFKSNFSHDYVPFKLWRFIANHEIYDQLNMNKNGDDVQNLDQICSDFFPLYRRGE